ANMYRGVGLQTPRGSGTNGYIQSNKCFVRLRQPVRVQAKVQAKVDELQQGQIRVPREASVEIWEHHRKRHIELKLFLLEETLVQQGYTIAEIAQQRQAALKALQESSLCSNTPDNTHEQVAAKKERRIEILKDVLGLGNVKEGQAFDRELQAKRKQERILALQEKRSLTKERQKKKRKT
ncbi:hypothetical protein GOP47_0022175, partial [Adiantum capillus-veneris]